MFWESPGFDAILHRTQPSAWAQFLSHPTLFLSRKIYAWYGTEPEVEAETKERPEDSHSRSPITVVCVSDTHNSEPRLPDGDILIHAGDLTQSGSLAEIQSAVDWLNGQPHQHKIAIAGNHDLYLDRKYSSLPSQNDSGRKDIQWGDVTYLQNSSVKIQFSDGRELRIYGSPLSPRHGNWAFQYARTTNVWDNSIPPDTDILITHGPPQGHLDLDRLGCKLLLEELWKLQKKPRLHVFGHVHEGYGVDVARFDEVQRAYDDAILANGGAWPLLRLIYVFLSSTLSGKRPPTTRFVNAAVAGGLRDETRRAPMVVTA